MANTMMQKFWDSGLALDPPDDYDTQSEMSALMASEATDFAKSSYPSLGLGNTFTFKFEDLKGRVHRFSFGTESLSDLLSAFLERIGATSKDGAQLMYEDDEGDKVLLSSNSDLIDAVNHARSIGVKVLRFHLDYSDLHPVTQQVQDTDTNTKTETSKWTLVHTSVLAGAIVLTGLGIMVYLKRASSRI